MALWNSDRQRQAYEFLDRELPNLRAAFRWATDHDDIDIATDIASFAGFLSVWIEQFEPAGWAGELFDKARTAGNRRVPQLGVAAAMCYATGQIDDSLRYADIAQIAIDSGRFERVPFDWEIALGAAYITIGQPGRMAQICRDVISREAGDHPYAWAFLAVALMLAGDSDGALATSERLRAAVNADVNPATTAFVLLAEGGVHLDVDPEYAYQTLRRGLQVAHDSGNRLVESHLASILSQLAVKRGRAADAFDDVILALNHFYDSGSYSHLLTPLALLAAVMAGLGRYEAGAVLAGHSATVFTYTAAPEVKSAETHLCEVLGEHTYESFAARGRNMTTVDIVRYALEQIAAVRAELAEETQKPPKA